MATKTIASSDYDDILTAELSEITRQESRSDSRASHIVTLAGILSTLSIASIGGLLTLAPKLSWWIAVPAVPLMIAALFWGIAIIVLLRGILRPSLYGKPIPGSFIDPHKFDYLRQKTMTQYKEDRVDGIGALLLRRYTRIRQAVDLLLAGFICAGLAVAGGLYVGILAIARIITP